MRLKPTASSLEALWYQLAGPVIARSKEIRAANTAAVAALTQELTALNATWEAQFAAAAQARAAAAAKAKSDAAAAEVAARAREERAFTASLSALGAGQLFTKADELDRAGEADKARAARTALINRFPNSPLAATAAQQMAGAGGGSATGMGGGRTTGASAGGATTGAGGQSFGSGTTSTGVRCATPNTGPNNPAFRQFDAANQAFINQWPNLNATGARDQFQYTIFLMANANRILEEHKACRSQQDHMGNKSYFDNAAAAAKRGCEHLTASAGDCRPVYPWRR